MGASISQVQSPQTSGGKGSPTQMQMPPAPETYNPAAGGPNMQPQGKGAASTNSATSGQPRMGQPNNYANTVGGWDNASIQPQRSGGKGKGY